MHWEYGSSETNKSNGEWNKPPAKKQSNNKTSAKKPFLSSFIPNENCTSSLHHEKDIFNTFAIIIKNYFFIFMVFLYPTFFLARSFFSLR